jgi:hypothetical protein
VGTCPCDMNLFDRHMQNCFDGILFYKVIDGVGEVSEWCSHLRQLSPRGNKMDILIEKI